MSLDSLSLSAPLAVVCVEHDDDNRWIVALSLGLDDQITTYPASSEAEYWALIDKGLQPDLALIADRLPNEGASSLMRNIRRGDHHEPPPFIVMATGGRASDNERYLEAGAIGVILKPFNPLTLAAETRFMRQAYLQSIARP